MNQSLKHGTYNLVKIQNDHQIPLSNLSHENFSYLQSFRLFMKSHLKDIRVFPVIICKKGRCQKTFWIFKPT